MIPTQTDWRWQKRIEWLEVGLSFREIRLEPCLACGSGNESERTRIRYVFTLNSGMFRISIYAHHHHNHNRNHDHIARFHVPLDGLLQNVGRNWESRGIPRRGDFNWVQMDWLSIRRTQGKRLLSCLWLRGGNWICVVRYWQKNFSFADNLIPNHILTLFCLFDRYIFVPLVAMSFLIRTVSTWIFLQDKSGNLSCSFCLDNVPT